MAELVVNLHMHTVYSDGTGSHRDIGEAALQAGVDVVIVTDHNVLVQGMEGYYQRDGKNALLLVGEEVHDQTRQPQKNHLLVFGAGREMSPYSAKPQRLIDQIEKAGGLAFIAHPYDPELKALGEDNISWVDWEVRGFSGLELWNAMSEMKSIVHGKLDGLFYTLFPQAIARGPHPSVLAIWDELTQKGQRVVVIGGSDAHAFRMRLGPIRKTVFPYSFHFRTVNTHILTDTPLTGNLETDRQMVLDTLRRGHAFVGYDLPASTRGFRFGGQAKSGNVMMGDDVCMGNGVTLQIRLPIKAECRLLHNGQVIRTWHNTEFCTYIAAQPGVYRVECYLEYMGRRRGWIFSNPIYVHL
ncbi:MAG: PHP domain-containing protein [Anaerolineaceae bacterium]|nr:PHP domain-containing protein [Anaerolineaceae bacterium]